MITDEMVEAGVKEIRKDKHTCFDRWTDHEAIRAILTAAFAAMPGPAVKKLEWVPITSDGRDIEAVTEFGKYTISVDSSFAGGTHYLWTPDQREYDDDHHSEHRGMTSARAAAQADYEARIMAAIEPQAQVRCRDCDGYNCDDGCAYPDTARVETSKDLASENGGLPDDVVESLLAIGHVEWGVTFTQPDEKHATDLLDSMRITREHFGMPGGDTEIHGVYLEGTGTVLAHTGMSPNSPQHARILVGAWNQLVQIAKAREALERRT